MIYDHAVITGASSGFGAAFAQRLAGSCAHLVLVARRADRLAELAATLREAHPNLQVSVRPTDLSQSAARATLGSELAALPPGRLLLINNAGLGDYGEFATADAERNRQMVQVNIGAVVDLTHAVVPRLKKQGGAIINIASLAADLFIPDFALYAASKAFVASFSEALRLELRGESVPVLAVCPGPVHTSFGDTARRRGQKGGSYPLKQWFYTPIETVTEGSLKALEHNRARYYPSRRVHAAALLLRLIPLFLMRLVMGCRPRRNPS